MDPQAGYEPVGLGKHIVHQNGGIGEDDSLDRGMGNVAFVPQRNVLERGLGVGANYSGQAPDLLASHWISLVRHGGGAFLPGSEWFFSLANLGALQMANFQRDLLECS